MTHKNREGYRDGAAGEVLGMVAKREKKRSEAVTNLITMLKQIISLAGFELEGRIILKDKETGKEYR